MPDRSSGIREKASAPPVDGPDGFFADALALFDRAAGKAGGAVEYHFSIAGFIVRTRFAGTAVAAALTSSLEHLAVEHAGPSDLTIYCYDAETSGAGLPRLPWPEGVSETEESVIRYHDDQFRIHCNVLPPVLEALDRHADRAFYALPAPGRVPFHLRATPLRIILHWWMLSRGRRLIHAGAVGNAQGGLLLGGSGGSGKSTAALACVQSGLHYVSDDYCLLAAGPEPHAYSIYNSVKLEVGQLWRFPFLEPSDGDGDHVKTFFSLKNYFPERLSPGFPLKAIVLPRVTGARKSRLTPASPAQALKTLAPSSMFQLPDGGADLFREIADAVRILPSYFLEAGEDLEQLAAAVGQLLEDL